MASKAVATAALLLILSLLFFTLVSANNYPPKTTPKTPLIPGKPSSTCPKDTLKLAVCANLLNDLVHLVVGTPYKTPCCTLIAGLVDLDAAVCLCTAIKAKILGINLNVPVSLTLLLNSCGKNVPKGLFPRRPPRKI